MTALFKPATRVIPATQTKVTNTTLLTPVMHVALSTQMAADSVGAIDQQIRAVQAIQVPKANLPRLASDLAQLHTALSQWPQSLRQTTIASLSKALSIDTAVLQDWKGVSQQDDAALLAYAAKLQTASTASETNITELSTQVSAFRTHVDQSLSSLQGDLQDISRQLTSEQQLANSLQAQVNAQRDRISYYQSHPWELVLAGLTIVGLIEDMRNIISAQQRAQAALSQLQQVQMHVQLLSMAQGPLLSLSMALTGLTGGVSNMQTAVQQIINKLADIQQQKLLPAIMAAQLTAVVSDLGAANAIIQEMLAGS